MAKQSVSIIGIGDDGLEAVSNSVRQLILGADLLAGKERTLALVPEAPGKRLIVGTDLDAVASEIDAAGNAKVAVLVNGDPLFYGLARFLCDRLGNDRCDIIPHVSSMQLAFARVKENWDEAYLTNLANHKLDTVIEKIRGAMKVGLFTTDAISPAMVAKKLLARKIDYFTVYVCENLGARNERVTRGTVAEIAAQEFQPLNVMVLVRDADIPDQPRRSRIRSKFGNADEEFVQSTPKHGLLTPAEVRAVALAQMALHSDSVVWDVGAGSGSVSIEAAQLSPEGQIFAIEQDKEDEALIRENADRFGVSNVTPVLGTAPEVWSDLPNPDAVFIEGSGKEIARLAELAFERLNPGGRLVAVVVSVQGLDEVNKSLTQKTSQVQVWMFNIARGKPQLERLRFESLNPTFLVAAVKG